jgi:NAD(P)-dependent dehydrogenase (short-subunit alcohol dehydrogenase family)
VGLLDGKVAFVTGAARGQGRSHALRLAREGARIIAIDIATAVSEFNGYPPATPDDLEESRRLLEDQNASFLLGAADVRDSAALDAVLAEEVSRFEGRLDVVVANAGICNWGRFWELPEEQWMSMIDINLSGVWRTMKAAVPHMLSAGNGGSIIAIKHGVTGLTKSAAIELGEYGVRVNSIHPWGVATPMGHDTSNTRTLSEHPNYAASFGSALPNLPLADPSDISDAVVWLASDLSRTVTGTQLTVDMGATKI